LLNKFITTKINIGLLNFFYCVYSSIRYPVILHLYYCAPIDELFGRHLASVNESRIAGRWQHSNSYVLICNVCRSISIL